MQTIFSNGEMQVVRYEGTLAGLGRKNRAALAEIKGHPAVSGVYSYIRLDEQNMAQMIRNVMVLDAIEAVLTLGQRCALYVLTKEGGDKRWAFVIGADIGERRIYPLGPVDKVSGL